MNPDIDKLLTRARAPLLIEMAQSRIDHIRGYHTVDSPQLNVISVNRLLSTFRVIVSLSGLTIGWEDEKQFMDSASSLIGSLEDENLVIDVRRHCEQLTDILTTLSSKLSKL